jgi:hypothetical protein
MAGLNKVEEFLIAMGVDYQEPQPGTWVVEDPDKGFPGILISHVEPIVVLSARVMKAPERERESFFEQLLRLNYNGLSHGAYALDGDDVVLIDTLEYDTMDKEEFEAAIDAIGFALTEHYPLLSRRKGE